MNMKKLTYTKTFEDGRKARVDEEIITNVVDAYKKVKLRDKSVRSPLLRKYATSEFKIERN